MLSQPDLEAIKETTKDFFEKATFEVEMELLPQEDLTLPISLNVEDPQILIGEGGQTLNEIQRLLKAILKRKIKEPFYIDLDINGYKKKKNEYLKEVARSIADEVSLTKKERALSPMPAHERRVIHLELSERTDIVTESVGQEPERKVVIKPRP
jgi:spoIIIJ-associated protein